MTRPGSVDPAAAIQALASFQIDKPRTLSIIESGNRNDNFAVEDAAGQKYVLRRFRRNPDRDRIAFEVAFQDFAFRHGLPVARVIKTRSGDGLLGDGSGLWALFSFLEGTEFCFDSLAQVAGAAAALKKFHVVASLFKEPEVAGRGGPSVRRWWTHGERLLDELGTMFARHGVDEELAFLGGWHTDVLREWPLDRLDRLPGSWVHGDYHGRNLTFIGAEVRGIFDFDLLHFGYAVEDVADAMFRFGREGRGSLRVRPGVAQRFVEEYDRHHPLTDEERCALPVMAPLVLARDAAYYRLIAADGRDPVGFLKEKVRIMRSRLAQRRDLARVLRV